MTRTATPCMGSAIRIECLASTFQQLAAEEGRHAMRIRLLDRHQGKAAA